MTLSADASPRQWNWRWFTAQFGSREYYAVPRSLLLTSRLGRMYTGTWCRRGRSLLRRGPRTISAYAGHWHDDLPDEKVISFDLSTIARTIHRQAIVRPRNLDEYCRWEARNCSWFDRRVLSELRRERLEPGTDAFFGFMSECRETLEFLRDQGVASILDLAGPGKMDDKMIQREIERWPGWAALGPDVPEPESFYERVRAECDAASLTLVNSRFSRGAWIEQGVPEEKIIVVPLAYEPKGAPPPPRQPHDGPMTVLWVGSVILRKGIPYLIEAAKLLKDARVQFLVAGPIGISEQAMATAPSNLKFLGRITAQQKRDLYRQADVFVIPTMSDGFAITQLEAMAQGMPVIATPNCGDVVTPGVDGLIVPAGDSQALADAIGRLEADRSLLASMSGPAIVKSRQFSVRRFGELVNQARDHIDQQASVIHDSTRGRAAVQ